MARTQRDESCNAVVGCYSAINNDVALEKRKCSFPGRVNVGSEMKNFLNA